MTATSSGTLLYRTARGKDADGAEGDVGMGGRLHGAELAGEAELSQGVREDGPRVGELSANGWGNIGDGGEKVF